MDPNITTIILKAKIKVILTFYCTICFLIKYQCIFAFSDAKFLDTTLSEVNPRKYHYKGASLHNLKI
jgi:hypothetical protein